MIGDFDLDFIDRFESEGGDGLSILEIRGLLDMKRFQNVYLVAASILLKTLLKYLDDNPEMRVSHLHLEIDTYEHTKCAIETLYDRVVPGGLLVFDDYGVAGETRAADEFVERTGLRLSKLTQYLIPVFC